MNQRDRTRTVPWVTESTVWVRTAYIKIVSRDTAWFVTCAEGNNKDTWASCSSTFGVGIIFLNFSTPCI